MGSRGGGEPPTLTPGADLALRTASATGSPPLDYEPPRSPHGFNPALWITARRLVNALAGRPVNLTWRDRKPRGNAATYRGDVWVRLDRPSCRHGTDFTDRRFNEREGGAATNRNSRTARDLRALAGHTVA